MDQETAGSRASLTEAFTFKLGKVMGGRKEVLETPAIELLKFMDLQMDKEDQEAEKERARVWLNYLTAVFTRPSYEKEDPKFAQARKEFIKAIQPQQKAEPTKAYEWDFERIGCRKASSERGG